MRVFLSMGAGEEDEVGNIVDESIDGVIMAEVGIGYVSAMPEVHIEFKGEWFPLLAGGRPFGDGGEGVADEGCVDGPAVVSVAAEMWVWMPGGCD